MHVVAGSTAATTLAAASANASCDRSGDPARRAVSMSLDRASPERPFAHADDGEPRRSHTPSRMVSMAAAPAMAKSPSRRANSTNAVPVPAGWRGIAQLDHHLAGLQRVRQHAGEELFGRQLAAARALCDHHRAIHGDQHARMLRRRIVVETLPQTVPRLRIAMCATCAVASASSGQPSRTSRAAQQIGMPDQRADAQAVRRRHRRRLSSSMRLMSTMTAGLSDAEVQHRHEALAAGQHPAVLPGLGQDRAAPPPSVRGA